MASLLGRGRSLSLHPLWLLQYVRVAADGGLGCNKSNGTA